MADEIERLVVLIEANTKSYERALLKLQTQTQQSIKATGASFGALDKSVSGLVGSVTKLGGAFGIAFGARALISQVRASVHELGDLSDAAERAGVSAEKLQVLRFAMEQTTGSAEQADAALSKFQVTLGQAATSGKGADLFKALAVNIRDASGAVRASSAVFDDVVKRFAQIKSPAQQAAVAVQLFGKQAGPDMAALLRDGGAGLDEFQKKMTDLGLLMSNDMVQAGDALDDKFKQWAGTIDVIWKKALIGASESIADTITNTNTISKRLDDFVANPSFKTYLQFLAGDYAGAIADFAGAPIVVTNTGGKGDRLAAQRKGANTRQPGASLPNDAKINLALLDTKATGEAEANAKAFQKRLDAIGKETAALQAENASWGASVAVQEKARTIATLLTDAEDLHSKVTDALRQKIEAQAEAYGNARQMAEDLQRFYSVVDDLAGRTFDAFDAVVSGSEKASDALKQLLIDLLKAEAKAEFLKLFNAASPAGPLSTLLGGLFGGFRAGGGSVDPGRVYGVGEKGPELFVPKVAGSIMPAGRGGGEPSVVQVHVVANEYFDARVVNVSGQVATVITRQNNRAIPGMLVQQQSRGG